MNALTLSKHFSPLSAKPFIAPRFSSTPQIPPSPQPSDPAHSSGEKPEGSKLVRYLKRLGLAGVIFMTVKGLISTTLIVAAGYGGCSALKSKPTPQAGSKETPPAEHARP